MNHGSNLSLAAPIEAFSIQSINLSKFFEVGDTPLFSQLINVSSVIPKILANSLI